VSLVERPSGQQSAAKHGQLHVAFTSLESMIEKALDGFMAQICG
jgi:hypothetical protein